jgi:hypothetical protein
MIWLYWSLLGLVVIGLLILALLDHRHRSPLRPSGPSTTQLLRTASRTWWELLWTVSHPFGPGGWHRRGPDSSRDYVEEKEAQRRRRRNPSDPK